jgi:hypothetical protein
LLDVSLTQIARAFVAHCIDPIFIAENLIVSDLQLLISVLLLFLTQKLKQLEVKYFKSLDKIWTFKSLIRSVYTSDIIQLKIRKYSVALQKY